MCSQLRQAWGTAHFHCCDLCLEAMSKRRGNVDVEEFLMKVDEKVSWEDYLAPQCLLEMLHRVGEEADPSHAERLRSAREKMYGAYTKQPSIPLIIFHGPPGAGKSFAMKAISSVAGLQPYVLQVKRLLESWEEFLFESILKELENRAKKEHVIVFVDEAEVLFPCRDTLANYASVDVRKSQRLIGDFLQWSEGLSTTKYPEGAHAPIICLATNMFQKLDPAIRDRARTVVEFGLPGPQQCAEWWSQHAKQLSSPKTIVLGWLSFACGLSYRGLWSISEKMVSRDAARQKEGFNGDVQFVEYATEILGKARERLPSVLELLQTGPRWIWTFSSLLFVLERFRWPRTRL